MNKRYVSHMVLPTAAIALLLLITAWSTFVYGLNSGYIMGGVDGIASCNIVVPHLPPQPRS
jgi:hypothetical protein